MKELKDASQKLEIQDSINQLKTKAKMMEEMEKQDKIIQEGLDFSKQFFGEHSEYHVFRENIMKAGREMQETANIRGLSLEKQMEFQTHLFKLMTDVNNDN